MNVEVGHRVGPNEWTKFSDIHWGRLVLGKRMDYWPTTGRFNWRGKTMFGDPEAFINELMEEHRKFQRQVMQEAIGEQND